VTARGPLPEVRADPELLHHVIDNLVGNALKYTRAGIAAQVEVSAHLLPGDTVRIEVADHGIGIPEADRPKIFDAFHRCANSGGYQGTGLGLAICRRIVERHGGRIGVEENPGGAPESGSPCRTRRPEPRPWWADSSRCSMRRPCSGGRTAAR
jgi:signal transduction histidine kinase